MSVYAGKRMLVSYHDGSHNDSPVLNASGVIGKQRGVLDEHQLVRIIPIADLQGEQGMITKFYPLILESYVHLFLRDC